MADRLTPEREAEIRRYVEKAAQRPRGIPQAIEMAVLCGHFADLLTELDAVRASIRDDVERAPVVMKVDEGSVLFVDVVRERDAERAARLAAEARVRELEADQDQAAQAVVDAQAGEMVFKERAEKAEAERDAAHRAWEPLTEQRNAAHAKLDRIAEALGRSLLTSGVHDGLPEAVADLRAQVARLREAATAVVSADAPPTEYGGCFAECSSAACIAYDPAHAGLRAALAEPGPTLEH